MNSFESAAALLVISMPILGVGCEDVTFPDPHRIGSLRVLGATAEPATIGPGVSTTLSVSCADGSRGATSDPTCDVEVAWFAGCNNPQDNDPKRCFASYAGLVEPNRFLTDVIADAPAKRLGVGPRFVFTAPDDILTDVVEFEGARVAYGTSYVYFAVCAGRLKTTGGSSDRLPVQCVDRESERPLPQSRFVFGVTAIYSYDLVQSRNPEVVDTFFDGRLVPASCIANACPEGFECAPGGKCAPVVKPCTGKRREDCMPHCVDLALSRESFHVLGPDAVLLPAPRKSLWIDYFSNAIPLPEDANVGLFYAQEAPVQMSGCLPWVAPAIATEHAHLWTVIRDNRGGLTVHDMHIIVR